MSTTTEYLTNLASLGAHVTLGCASNGPMHGWNVHVEFSKAHAQTKKIATPFGMMLQVTAEEVEADLSTDYTHDFEITVWDTELDRAVMRAAETFMAAYASSVTHAPEQMAEGTES